MITVLLIIIAALLLAMLWVLSVILRIVNNLTVQTVNGLAQLIRQGQKEH